MKKLYSFLILLMLACTTSYKASAQTNLGIIHGVADTIEIGNQTPAYIFGYGFINFGANALTQTDTIYLKTPYTGTGYFILTLPVAGLPVGDTVYFFDTVAFTSGPATGIMQWCDSIWARNSSNAIIVDDTLSNNKICDAVQIINDPASVPGELLATKAANSTKLNVYPNPAVNSASFDYYTNSYAEASVSVTDITGRQVYKQNLGNGQGARNAKIDITGLSNGVYIVELRTGNTKQVGKFVIQK